MVVLGQLLFAILVLVLKNIVHALQGPRLQLIDVVIEHLQSSDADHGHVVGGVRNLDTEREGPNEDLRQFSARHEDLVTLIVILLAGKFAQDPKNHAHEGTHDIGLLNNTRHLLILSRKLQLILTKLRIQRQDVRVDDRLDLVDYLEQFPQAYFDDKLVDARVHQHEY